MICPKCGTELPDGSKFCDVCGASMAAPHSAYYNGGTGMMAAYFYGEDESTVRSFMIYGLCR